MGLIQTICFWELLRIAASSYQKEKKREQKQNKIGSDYRRFATLLKETPTQVFSYEIYDIFKNTVFYRKPPVTASLSQVL